MKFILLATTFTTLLFATLASAQKSPTPAPSPNLSPPGAPGADITKMRSLLQVEPRIPINFETCPPHLAPGSPNGATHGIDTPGSYYLTGNLKTTGGRLGIYVATPGVTIDLNGFSLIGDGGSLTSGVQDSFWARTSVINGVVTNWGEGLRCHQAFNITARLNSTGIYASHVQNCIAEDNTGAGILGHTVQNCRANSNGYSGIQIIRDGGVAIDNVCTANGTTAPLEQQFAIWGGIWTYSARCRIESNHVSNNRGAGIRVEAGTDASAAKTIVVRNTAFGNYLPTGPNNYDIAPGNFVGKIITATPNSTAISGTTTTPSGLGTSNAATSSPWANFSD